MRAVMFDRYGDETVLAVRDIPEPAPAPGEVQVRVSVASLNPVDFKLRAGLFRLIRRPRLPAITGKDFAGRISAIGANVTGFHPGQRVFGSVNPMQGRGACVETLVIPTGLIAATPQSISDQVAACLPVAAGTALQALQSIARLRQGQSLLVSGASGAVGSSAVQIARSMGAHVTGVCSTGNVAFVRGIGADEVVDYTTTDWRRLGKTFDVIFDAAGASTFWALRHQLSPQGTYLNTVPTPGMFLTRPLVGLLSGRRSVPFMLETDAGLLQNLADLAQRQVLQPRVARVIGLEDVAGAQRQMREGRIHGKVCVAIDA